MGTQLRARDRHSPRGLWRRRLHECQSQQGDPRVTRGRRTIRFSVLRRRNQQHRRCLLGLCTGTPTIKPTGRYRTTRAYLLGRGFDDSEVETALEQYKGTNRIHYKHVENIERLTAETLARGEVVARAKGRMEFGARALGNRSILARADNMEAVRIINDMVKNRDFWMPFAPAVLAERAEDYYLKPKPMFAPYMIIAFDSRPEARSKCVAGQHPYDHSVRPQEVTEEWNPDFYRLTQTL